MWNYLRSDLYRIFHMRSFYFITILLFLTGSVLSYVGFDVYYTMKAPYYSLFTLLLISFMHSEEYESLFYKNMYPYIENTYKLMIVRYVVNVAVCFMMIGILLIAAMLINALTVPLHGNISIGYDIIFFVIVETLLLCCVSSFLVMITQITRSKAVVVLVAFAYSLLMIYALEIMLANFFLQDTSIIRYTIYGQFSGLPIHVQSEAYRTALLISFECTGLYTLIGSFVLKFRDK